MLQPFSYLRKKRNPFYRMKSLFYTLLFCYATTAFAQFKPEMTPQGFAAIELQTPPKTNEKLIEAAKGWAASYNKKTYDVYDVTENALSIDGWKENAYFYRHLGERYDYNIKYTLKVVFNKDKTYTITFILKEVYAKEALVKTQVADFFTPDGKLKEDFEEVKPSLENTVERILKSFSTFIAN